VQSNSEILAPVASLVNVHQFRARARLVGPGLVLGERVRYHVFLWHGTCSSVCWTIKSGLKSGPVTADLTITVVYTSLYM